jgi:transcriptional regulator with XRE-family HTH domain
MSFQHLSVRVPDGAGFPRVENPELGAAIRALRRERRRTIEDLAGDARMHPTYLSGIERGIRNPTWDKLASVAEALDVPVSVIVQTAEDRRAEEAIRTAATHAYRAVRARERSGRQGEGRP